MNSINVYYDNEYNIKFLHTCVKQNIELCLIDLNFLNLKLDTYIKKFIKKNYEYLNFSYINAFYINDDLYVNIKLELYDNFVTLKLENWKQGLYNINVVTDFKPIYYTYIPGEVIDEVQYNYYWNNNVFTYATFDKILPESKFELKIKNNYQLINVIPVFNTKNVFIFELTHKNSEEKKFLLLKDYKLFEFKLNEQFISITLDIFTYKLYGLNIVNLFESNVEYTLSESNDYFEQLI